MFDTQLDLALPKSKLRKINHRSQSGWAKRFWSYPFQAGLNGAKSLR